MSKFTLDGKEVLKTAIQKGNIEIHASESKMTYSGILEERVKNDEDLIRVAKIDTKQWKIDRWVCNKWEVSSKIGDTKMAVQDLWQVKAWLVRNTEVIQLNNIKDAVIQEMKKHAPKYPRVIRKMVKNPSLLVVDIPDLHFDKLAWGKETGEDWDIKESGKVFLDMVDDLIRKSSVYEIEKVLFPIGNDFFTSEGSTNLTSAGTPQSVDSRWKKSFIMGKKLLIEAIDRLMNVADVDVIIIPGNHDKAKTFFLGETLESWYHNCKQVNVDNSPPVRKYYEYGNTLLGYTHGKDEKIDRLPMILATEAKDKFAKTVHHEWHLGDKHHKKDIKYTFNREVDGVIIRFLSSLSPADQWHYEKGYLAQRAAQGFIYDRQQGWVCQFNSYVQ